jgi:hypothetical protein
MPQKKQGGRGDIHPSHQGTLYLLIAHHRLKLCRLGSQSMSLHANKQILTA